MAYQEILFETKPDVVVEAGTYKGGSAYWFATMFDLLQRPGPMEATRQFMAGRTDFMTDRSRERYMLTVAPEGYLRRLR